MRFRLTPRSMTLDDLALSSNFQRISRDFSDFERSNSYKRMNLKIDQRRQQRCKQLNVYFSTLCSSRLFAVDFFAGGLRTRTAVARLP